MRRDRVTERIRQLSPTKQRLLERLLEEKSYDASSLKAAFQPPRTLLETHLAAIWEDVLGIDGIGVEDNFFDLGGDSILSIRIVAKAQSRAIPLSSRLLFEAPTIAGLAARLEPELGSQWVPTRGFRGASEPARTDSPTGRLPGTSVSPGDFPEAELSQEDLTTVLARVASRAAGARGERIERRGWMPQQAVAL